MKKKQKGILFTKHRV